MNVDLIAKNRDGHPVLIVKVTATPLKSGSVQLAFFHDELATSPESVEFGMFVDPIAIRVFRREVGVPCLVLTLDSIEVLSHYSEDFQGEETVSGTARVAHMFLVTLVEAWLTDLVLPWKEGETPRKDAIRSVGLLSQLEHGWVAKRDLMSADPLR